MDFKTKTNELIDICKEKGFNIKSHIKQTKTWDFIDEKPLWTESYLCKVLTRKLNR